MDVNRFLDSSTLRYFDPPLEETDIVLIDEGVLAEAEDWIEACERCTDRAEWAFDQLIDSITGCDPTRTDYLMSREARCRSCHSPVTEKTLVRAR